MFKMYRYLKHYLKEVILGPIFKLVEAIFELIVPLVMADIIDKGIKNNDINYIWQRGGILVLLAFVGLSSTLVCQFFASRACQGYATMVRNDLFKHINNLSQGEIDKIGTTSLITRMTTDIDQMQASVAMLIRLVVRAPFLVIGATIMAFTISPKMALIFVVAGPLIALTLYLIMSKSIPYFKVIQSKLDKTAKITRENLAGVRVVRAFSKQDYEVERFKESTIDCMNTNIKVSRISALLSPLTFLIVNVAIIFIIYYGGINVNVGDLTQGQVIALVNYMNQILLALVVVANLVVIFTKASASAGRLNEVFALSSSIIDGTKEEEDNDYIFAFDNVSFAYPDASSNSLDNISFKVKAGEVIGIIGGTGTGKSTIIKLLTRAFDSSSGVVYFNGCDIKEQKLENIRKDIGIVPQKAVLFKGTIRENMCFRKENATDEEIIEAIKIAQGWDFVSKLGLDYEIEQGGKNLSGGQRQRLTIARALVGNPRLIILDDSASALDLKTDANLREALKGINVTTIIISQRATSIRHADQIIVLDDGNMVGRGTHEELLANCEVYQEICYSQMNKEEISR